MKTERVYCVYIMTNTYNTTFYTGVTNDLERRVSEHKSGNHPGFTRRYNLTRLVYYEFGDDIASAIAREKQIKGGSRQDKIDLILSLNPECKDLFPELFESETIPSPVRQT
jgi:putative endonuclease